MRVIRKEALQSEDAFSYFEAAPFKPNGDALPSLSLRLTRKSAIVGISWLSSPVCLSPPPSMASCVDSVQRFSSMRLCVCAVQRKNGFCCLPAFYIILILGQAGVAAVCRETEETWTPPSDTCFLGYEVWAVPKFSSSALMDGPTLRPFSVWEQNFWLMNNWSSAHVQVCCCLRSTCRCCY